jgi:membrane associated rhomboid family serine protease
MAGPVENAAIVYRSTSRRACHEHALVLRARGIECRVLKVEGEFALLVAGWNASAAAAELAAYDSENRDELADDDNGETASFTGGWTGVLCYVTAILLVAVCKDLKILELDWIGAGKTSARLIRDGQWWRTITALTLHADPAHLLANAFFGGIFGLFAARLLGSGLAWFAILIGGAWGNALNALLREAEHTSVGASTSIFAALGILSSFAWIKRRSGRVFSMARWAPLIGGAILLGYLGVGDERTDVGAHVLGFVCGVLLGAACGRFDLHQRVHERGQAILAWSTVALLVIAWIIAFFAPGMSRA